MKNVYKFHDGLFYPPDLNYESIPDSAIEVSSEEYIKAMSRAPGSTFTVNDAGVVTIIPAPEPTQEQRIAQAEVHKQFLLDEATQRITIWQTKLLMGRKLTDDESASLNAWMDYIDEVAKTKDVTAPDIVLPTPPGEQAN
ncbi:phage tail protein [Escherichia coli]|nr:tail fiber assembly protein [Escherichia coli]PCD70895.1 phage tail protein [Escherichia coli]